MSVVCLSVNPRKINCHSDDRVANRTRATQVDVSLTFDNTPDVLLVDNTAMNLDPSLMIANLRDAVGTLKM